MKETTRFPHPENPHYLRGDLQKILNSAEFKNRISQTSNKVTIVCHPIGHGTEGYLQDIQADLSDLGFDYVIVRY
jgi:hypothetical protein